MKRLLYALGCAAGILAGVALFVLGLTALERVWPFGPLVTFGLIAFGVLTAAIYAVLDDL